MKCPNCNSTKVRHSLRRGMREGTFMRLLLLSPYRCKDCNARFFGFSGLMALRTLRKHRTLAGCLGLHNTELRRYQRALGLIIIFAIMLLFAVFMVHLFSLPSAPSPQ
jgi:transposase-like protein